MELSYTPHPRRGWLEAVEPVTEMGHQAGTADNILRDGLTGAHSRATLQDRAREEVERARRYELPLSLLVADLDHFKSINDALGHTRGDLVLIGFVERLHALIRDSDLLFRYGGGEFVLVLLHTDRQQALALAGRLLEGIRSVLFPGAPPLSVTLSIGSASFPDDGQSPEDLFECADRRLYEAKRRGRDRVVIEDSLAPLQMTSEAGSRMMERELTLATLRQFFDQLPARQYGALSISGPLGCGKTWFLADAVKMARLTGYAAWALEGRHCGREYTELWQRPNPWDPPCCRRPRASASSRARRRATSATRTKPACYWRWITWPSWIATRSRSCGSCCLPPTYPSPA
jgi:diguanylate cyclase (GGDEF)-like protein